MAQQANVQEEELKRRVAEEWFSAYDTARSIGKIDFCVSTRCPANALFEPQSLLWAEAKRGAANHMAALAQLILTIGRWPKQTIEAHAPPRFLGAFDAVGITFVEYSAALPLFLRQDINWQTQPSEHGSKEFQQLRKLVEEQLARCAVRFNYDDDARELTEFIQLNFALAHSGSIQRIRVTSGNFLHVYWKWLKHVKDSIALDWQAIYNEHGVIDGDFFLADLLSREGKTLGQKLHVLLARDHYTLGRLQMPNGLGLEQSARFRDGQQAHTAFWERYERPPEQEYWDYIVARRDLLVPPDIRERKGAFYTPQRWVELSQRYLEETLGSDWQQQYYVWDCAAGTGNLLNGLTEKHRVWASTLDVQDVDVMHDRITNGGSQLLKEHVFQFDFLNDELDGGKLPEDLLRIINDEKERRRLIIYINPPYAEGDARIGHGRRNVQVSRCHAKHGAIMGRAKGELFAQFIIRAQQELPGIVLAQFSKLKIAQAPNFFDFRGVFRARFLRGIIVPACTFDNVRGEFPIGFFIWDTNPELSHARFTGATMDVYNAHGRRLGQKRVSCYDGRRLISDWLGEHARSIKPHDVAIGRMASTGNDFQHHSAIFVDNVEKRPKAGGRHTLIRADNLHVVAVYYAVRKCIPATWLNDRDQFLWPSESWQHDAQFIGDCLAFLLLDESNVIQRKYGVNHWIPYTEKEVEACGLFASHFMSDYIAGKRPDPAKEGLFEESDPPIAPITFGPEAQEVLNAGRALWGYYHAQPGAVADASYYDIRAHFQGRNERGVMRSKSDNARYMELLGHLKAAMEALRQHIAPRVYEHGFLTGDDLLITE